MDFSLSLSLIMLFGASVFAELAVFNKTDTIVARLVRAIGIYISLLVGLAYLGRLLGFGLSPLYIGAASLAILAISKRFGKGWGRADWSIISFLPALGLLAAAFVMFLFVSAPDFFPISSSSDAASHFAMVQSLTTDAFMSPPPTAWRVSFHTVAALHLVALGIAPINGVYPFVVAIIALSAIAVYAVVHSKTKDAGLAFMAGIMLLVSDYTYATLWESGTWAQIMAQLLAIILVFVSTDYVKKMDWGVLLVMALCAQAILFTHTFIAIVPFLFMAGVLLCNSDRLGLKLKKMAVFALVAVVFPLPYLYLCANAYLIKSFIFDVWGSITTDVLGYLGMPLVLLLSAGIGYVVGSKYDLKDDRALRLFALSTAAALFAFYVAVNYFGFATYWYNKLWFIAIYPLIIYAALVLDRLLARLSAPLRQVMRLDSGAARFIVLSPVLIAWLLYPIVTHDPVIRDYHHAVTQDEYAAFRWMNESGGIKRIAAAVSWPVSYNWAWALSGKEPAAGELACLVPPDTVACAAGLITASDNGTAVFVQNYSALTSQELPSQKLVVVGDVCANVLFTSGDAVVLSKARNTGADLERITLIKGNNTVEIYRQGSNATRLVPFDASNTGIVEYRFALDEQPEQLFLRISRQVIDDESYRRFTISADGATWREVPIVRETLGAQDTYYASQDTYDVTSFAENARYVHVRAEFEDVPFHKFSILIGPGNNGTAIGAVGLIGCSGN